MDSNIYIVIYSDLTLTIYFTSQIINLGILLNYIGFLPKNALDFYNNNTFHKLKITIFNLIKEKTFTF